MHARQASFDTPPMTHPLPLSRFTCSDEGKATAIFDLCMTAVTEALAAVDVRVGNEHLAVSFCHGVGEKGSFGGIVKCTCPSRQLIRHQNDRPHCCVG